MRVNCAWQLNGASFPSSPCLGASSTSNMVYSASVPRTRSCTCFELGVRVRVRLRLRLRVRLRVRVTVRVRLRVKLVLPWPYPSPPLKWFVRPEENVSDAT